MLESNVYYILYNHMQSSSFLNIFSHLLDYIVYFYTAFIFLIQDKDSNFFLNCDLLISILSCPMMVNKNL